MRVAHAARITVVPQGGLTGLSGGGVPTGPSLLLSMRRMNRIEEVDADALTATVQAGVVLQSVQEAVAAADLMFPLDFGGRGSAQIGGIISTNAGGNRVIRFGMARDLTLGMEVVLADGTVLSMLNKMIKNNSGYDLKHAFIGAEGTLGIITRAVLRLVPPVRPAVTALCGLGSFEHVLELLRLCRRRLGSELCAFEVMWPDFYRIATMDAGRQSPLSESAELYVLLEAMNHSGDPALCQAVLEEAADLGIIADAAIASSEREGRALWNIRESTDVLVREFRTMAAFDACIQTGRIGDFVTTLRKHLIARWPGIQMAVFGHIADGNLHISVRLDGAAGTEQEVEAMVYRMVGEWGGAVSGEHGIGSHKVPFLRHARSATEIETMRVLKGALDPRGTLNPGKVLSVAP